MKSFSNHFLISMPHMNDPIFSKSLIYICENTSDGSLGLIINKPMVSQNAADILQKTGLEIIQPAPEVYLGGPVNMQMGLILHDPEYNIEGTKAISKTLALTSNKQIVADMINGDGPDIFRFSFGYAGWGGGQIEREIENGDWLIVPSDLQSIFKSKDDEKWDKLYSSLIGFNLNDLGGQPGKA